MENSDAKRARRASVAKARFWFGRLEAQQRSGPSIPAYCKEHRLACASFPYWRRKQRAFSALSPEQDMSEPAPITIVPVPMAALERLA